MTLGVLDIGSDSARLQIMEGRVDSAPVAVRTVKEPTLLAEAIQPDGSVAEDGIRRVLAAVGETVALARRHRVRELIVFATSAIRDATNREEILDRIGRDTGVRPQYLTGEDEAALTFGAVRVWYGSSAGRLLVLDIGGGSLEVAWGGGIGPELTWSLPLGAGRLTRSLVRHDPPTTNELAELRRHVRANVAEVVDRLGRRCRDLPVATSKTFKQLARLTGSPPQRRDLFARRTVHSADLAKCVPRLASMPRAERAELRGISAPRAGQIVAGAVTAHTLMEELGIDAVEVCPWALREGIALCHQVGDRRFPLAPVELASR